MRALAPRGGTARSADRGDHTSDQEAPAAESGISTRTMEIVVALALLAVSALVIVDSYRLGSKWGDDGPQSGYFPFYIGLLLGAVEPRDAGAASPSPNGGGRSNSAARPRSARASSSRGAS